MKKFFGFVLFLLAMSIVACGGTVVIDGDGDVESMEMPPLEAGDDMDDDKPEMPEYPHEETPKEPPPCEPTITVSYLAGPESTAQPGDEDVHMLSMELSIDGACGEAVEIMSISMLIFTPDAEPSDTTPFCASPCDPVVDWNFGNLKLKEPESGVTKMGPTELAQLTVNAPASVQFTDSFSIQDGEASVVSFTMNVNDPLKTPIQGMRFAPWFIGLYTEPYTILSVGPMVETSYLTIE